MKSGSFLALILLGGCMVGPNYEPPEVPMPEEWQLVDDHRLSENEAHLSEWWKVFNDPMLDKLIASAVENNLDLGIAWARVMEARAARRIEQGGLFPKVDGGVGASRIRGSRTTDATTFFLGDEELFSNSFEVGLDAVWELDIFGKVRRSIESAQAGLEAEVNEWRNVMVSLLAEVATSYIQVRGSQKRIVVLEKNILSQEEVVEVTQLRYEAGISSYLDVAQATRVLETTRSEVPQVEGDLYEGMYRLGVLLGSFPTDLIEELRPYEYIPKPPLKIPLGLPSDLLLRRPDILRAERELAASSAEIGVAVAERFPKFPLTGALGFQSGNLANLFKLASSTWQAAAEALAPLFRGGALVANVDRAKAVYLQTYANFEKTVLVALEEVQNATTRYTEEERRFHILESAQEASQASLDLSLELYTTGLTDFLSVLDAQRALFIIEDQLVVSEAVLTGNAVAIYKALGGGWDYDCQ